jgi:hypothetical protein
MDDDRVALGQLMGRFFAAVSFSDGGRPGYDTLHQLFVEGGTLIKCTSDTPEITSVEAFVRPRQAVVDSGALTSFRETEVTEVTEAFGNVGHRFSTYTKHGVMNGVPMEGRGAIVTQFVRTPQGWRISSMAWDDERAGRVLPARDDP